jgi:methyl-accepting chemotaxis protein
VKQTAEQAQQASEASVSVLGVAREGQASLETLVRAMSEINQSSKRIADIIGLVDEIAFQTNLLALNAAVEAARAGEQGRGFAVVATEVRNLAKRSADAAREIKSLIRESVNSADNGSQMANASHRTIQAVSSEVQHMTDNVDAIARAAQEQSNGLREIHIAVTQMDEVTQQNAALVEEASASAETLDHQAQTLADLMVCFLGGAAKSTAKPKAAASARRAVGAGPSRKALATRR